MSEHLDRVASAATSGLHDVGGVLLGQPFKIRRFGHIGWWTEDKDNAKAFYRDRLGMIEPSHGLFLRFTGDHHNMAFVPRAGRKGPGGRPLADDMRLNQAAWQVQSIGEIIDAERYFRARGVETGEEGRETGNHSVYFYDPEGFRHELFYGIDQIGWDGLSKPSEYERISPVLPELPMRTDQDQVNETFEAGVRLDSGHRGFATSGEHDVDGLLLGKPFRVVDHAPLYLFVKHMDETLEFYRDILGFVVTETVNFEGHDCVYLRHSGEHHSLALIPTSLQERLGSTESSTYAYGLRMATYRQLRDSLTFLAESGVKVETSEVPLALHPGIDYAAYVYDNDGNRVLLYYYMERIGWDGRPRPVSERRAVDPDRWPEALEPASDVYSEDPFFGPLG